MPKIKNNDVFPIRLRESRIKRNLTMEELAELSGVSKSAISKYELGESVPTVNNVIDIAKVLEVPLSHLVGEELNRVDKLNYINYIMKKHNIEAGFMNVDKLTDDEIMRFEQDVLMFLQYIQQRYNLK